MKLKATYTVTKVYDVHPANYPPESTPEGIVELDRAGIMEDPDLFFSDVDTEELTLEVVEEQEED